MSTEPHPTLLHAVLAAQADMPAIQKTKINPAFKSKYVSLDSLMETVVPLLNKHGLVWMTFPCFHDGTPGLHYQLAHAHSGEKVEGRMPLMIDKQNSQGQGSAITYSRRYSLMAVLGLVADEDDDGNKASERRSNGHALASPEDVESMVAAAKGLKPEQVKLALAACGIENVDTYGKVPAAKTAQLAKALAGIERQA